VGLRTRKSSQRRPRRSPAKATAVVTALLCSRAIAGPPPNTNVVLRWDRAALEGVRISRLGAPMVSRALAVVHTCMYDAWAAYDEHAIGTELKGALRRPPSERTAANKKQAISYAAYRALVDLMPAGSAVYTQQLRQLGYDAGNRSTDIETPAGVGNVACAAVLEFRHHDGSNQLGDLAPGPYSDWTAYSPANAPNNLVAAVAVADPNKWQPLVHFNADGDLVSQRFLASHWASVIPFALSAGDQFRSSGRFPGPATFGSPEYREQAEELVAISAGLNDRQKAVAEYWKDGPNSEQPAGHWALLAHFVSQRDGHSLDADVEMFFALTNAMFDAGIVAWDMKRAYDSVRPITAIPLLFRGTTIRAWGGPGKGTIEMDGAWWRPYQPATDPTPPFPEYVSGHSTYSAAAARILALFTGSDRFGAFATVAAGSSKIEPGITPAGPVLLRWETFTDAANEAGISRRYGGIHFKAADLVGRELGQAVATQVWTRVNGYFDGSGKTIVEDKRRMISARSEQ